MAKRIAVVVSQGQSASPAKRQLEEDIISALLFEQGLDLKYDEVEAIANRYLEQYATGELDRLDVAYTKFVSISKQVAVVETLLPLGSLTDGESGKEKAKEAAGSMYEFMPSAESILQEVVPTSFKVKLFKCFLDAAVSEQIARMVAMKSATENASDMIKELSRTYNRARQSQITGEIMEIIGGVEALKK